VRFLVSSPATANATAERKERALNHLAVATKVGANRLVCLEYPPPTLIRLLGSECLPIGKIFAVDFLQDHKTFDPYWCWFGARAIAF
jgi:hypothetical protein